MVFSEADKEINATCFHERHSFDISGTRVFDTAFKIWSNLHRSQQMKLKFGPYTHNIIVFNWLNLQKLKSKGFGYIEP